MAKQNRPAALRAWQRSWQLLGEQLHDQLARSKCSWQSWQDLVGDEGYGFDKLLPFFNKVLCFTPPKNAL